VDAAFFASVAGIVLIDLVLAGDNAVVIAMAVHNLPPSRRRQGIALGAAAAVALRVAATFFVSQLLRVSLVKLMGGTAVLWIGVKLFVEGMPEEGKRPPPVTLWEAVRLIVIADITLSIDNMLAVGGAAQGNFFLLLFGLCVSVPFVVLMSNVLSTLMDRYPVIVAGGAAVLGKVGVEMIVTDPFAVRMFPLGIVAQHVAEAIGAVGVLLIGALIMRYS